MAEKGPYSADDIKRIKRKYYSSIPDGLKSKNIKIFVNEELRTIYIWKGLKSTERERIISSHVAHQLQKELIQVFYYSPYKIISIEEGNEPNEFLENIGEYLKKYWEIS